ncbi:hypothetical protein FHR72_004549 [Mycolicibacterium iranicum]|uniref:GAF domain-containing protein n=1 Tax=Mycolicibacterium iranicum TaxID=912594 RepID=A0A839QIK7_MYCIR|nr:hypothetical protein [Mycolicibacterium iranicum]MBB2993042.1 hypothetical protein [Mycolicibacterium iranicum]
MNLLTTDGRRITSASSDGVGERLNALYDRFADNPGAHAWRSGATIATTTMPHLGAWPEWLGQARALGVGSVLTAVLKTQERRLGYLLAFSVDAKPFSLSEAAVFAEFARDAAYRIAERQLGSNILPAKVVA